MLEPVIAAGSRLLVQFRAGRMRLEGKMLSADPKKGLLRLIRSEDGLLHVQWFERKEAGSAEEPEEDIVVFPEEARFQKASKGSQRVNVLKFAHEPDRNLFLWMQEPDAARDEALIAQVDRLINSPVGLDEDEAVTEGGDEAAWGQVVPRDALELAHVSGAAAAGAEEIAGTSVGLVAQAPGQTPTALSHEPSNAENSAQRQQELAQQLAQSLSSSLRNMQQAHHAPAPAGDPSSSLAAALAAAMARTQQQQQATAPGPSLAEVLKPEVLVPLLAAPDVLERLAPFLPEVHRTPQAVADLAHSPHFQQQLATFGMALQTGQLDLSQFGLQAEGFTVADFLRAVQQLVEREAQGGGK